MTLDNLSFTLSSPLVERWTVSQGSSHRWGRRWFWWLIWYEHSAYKNAYYLHPQSSAGGAPLLTSLQVIALLKTLFLLPPPHPRTPNPHPAMAQQVKNSSAMQETQEVWVPSPWVRKIPWRRKWQPTPVFLPGEFHGQRSLAGYSPWGHKESDTTEWLRLSPSLPRLSVFLVTW